MLGGSAEFRYGDLFDLYADDAPRYNVIHHQGVLEHFTVPQIHAALAQQVASANWVVFSVPSVYYPIDPEFGDERLMPVEEWRHILEPFDIEELRYYGDPVNGERDRILGVLRGRQRPLARTADMSDASRREHHPSRFGEGREVTSGEGVDDKLRALMVAAGKLLPFREEGAREAGRWAPGISAVVHTRNETQICPTARRFRRRVAERRCRTPGGRRATSRGRR